MEPTVKSTSVSRVAERRARIQARKNKQAIRDSGQAVDEDTKNVEQISASKQAIKEARDTFDLSKETAIEEVSNVKLDREHAEILRKREESRLLQERVTKLETEMLQSAKAEAEIEQKWVHVAEEKIAQTLYQEFGAQFKAASDLLGNKVDLINGLKAELKVKDEDYVELLASHQDDTQSVVTGMKEQFATLLATSKDLLESIEITALSERGETLKSNLTEVDALFTKRRKMELDIMEAKLGREEEFQSELSRIRLGDAEDYNSLKIQLENNIQLLEQQLEEMRATYQLNTEKLDYNHKVLEERNQENKATVEHHRRRIRHLKESLMSSKSRFHTQNNKYRNSNEDLTNDYKRMTEQFKDLQRKYHHFEMVDTKKYREVWAMNEGNVMSRVHKVLLADQAIHQQILGLQWKPPGNLGVASGFVDVSSITANDIFNAPLEGFEDIDSKKVSAKDFLGENNNNNNNNRRGSQASMVDGGEEEEDTSAITDRFGLETSKNRFTNQQIRWVLQILAQETTFLVDGRSREGLRGKTVSEQQMQQVDIILNSLGVEDREDLEDLVAFFYEDPSSSHPTVDPNDVVTKVKEFLVKRQQSKTKHVGVIIKTRSVQSEKKARKKERERKFWKKLASVVSPKTLNVWDALEDSQRKYNTILEERASLIDETTELARQNEELKILLQEYLSSDINDVLEVPPTRLITLNQK